MKSTEPNPYSANQPNSTSVLFGTTFVGKVNQRVRVDIGVDVNLMDEELFQKNYSTRN